MDNTPPYDEKVRADLERFRVENDFTHAQMASKLGLTSPSRLNKYLRLNQPGRTPEPDAIKVEAAARRFLRRTSRDAQLRESLFENSVSRDVATVLNQARRTGGVALIHSNGGLGKTCGALIFCGGNDGTLFTTTRQYGSGAWNLEQAIYDEFCDNTDEKWPRNCRRAFWLEKKLRGTDRLLIVDDAEYLHISAFRLIFSLHDATGMPVAFIGNPEVLDTLRNHDSSGKLLTRMGIVHEARMKDDEEETAERLVAQFAPASGTELVELVMNVVAVFGHCRRARQQLTLTTNIHEGSKGRIAWTDAFQKAETMLVKLSPPTKGRKR